MNGLQRHTRRLNYFHTTCLRKLLGIKRQDKIPDTEVLRRARLPSINIIMMQSQLRWAGHVVSMLDHRLPKRQFYCKLEQGKPSPGGHKKCYKDTLKVSLNAFDINIDVWEQTALDRGKWRAYVQKGAKTCRANRTATAEQCRQVMKNSANRSLTAVTISCPHCQKSSRAQINNRKEKKRKEKKNKEEEEEEEEERRRRSSRNKRKATERNKNNNKQKAKQRVKPSNQSSKQPTNKNSNKTKTDK